MVSVEWLVNHTPEIRQWSDVNTLNWNSAALAYCGIKCRKKATYLRRLTK